MDVVFWPLMQIEYWEAEEKYYRSIGMFDFSNFCREMAYQVRCGNYGLSIFIGMLGFK